MPAKSQNIIGLRKSQMNVEPRRNQRNPGPFTVASDAQLATMAAGQDIFIPMKTRILILLATSVTMAAKTFGQGVEFSSKLLVPDLTWATAVGDVTGDGHVDVTACVDGTFNGVEIFPGRGDGTFASPIQVATPIRFGVMMPGEFFLTLIPHLADLNRDGIQDVVLGCNDRPFTVIWGSRSGLFRIDKLGSEIAGWPENYTGTIAITDLNRDGRPDVIGDRGGTNDATHLIVTLLSTGTGTYVQRTQIAQFRGGLAAIADFNLDGNPDLVVYDSSVPWPNTALKVLLGQENGTFVSTSLGLYRNPWALSVEDINRDGKPDISVVTDEEEKNATVRIFFGHGDGSFDAHVGFQQSRFALFGIVDPVHVGQVAFADFTGDGIVDAAAALNQNTLGLYRGENAACFSFEGNLACHVLPYDVQSADFDEDGRPDLLVRGCWGEFESIPTAAGSPQMAQGFVLLNQSAPSGILWQFADGRLAILGSSTIITLQSLPRGNWQLLAFDDFNGDGSSDLLMRNPCGQLQIWYLNNSTFVRAENLNCTAPSTTARPMGFADVDGDGRKEVVWNTGSSFVLWSLRGSKVTSQSFMKANPALGQSRIVGVGDFDGDGYADIVAQDKSGRMIASLQQGIRLKGFVRLADGRKATPQWHPVSVADFNGDKKPDIVWQHDDGRVAVWLMDGTKLVQSKLLLGGKPAGRQILTLH